MNAIEGERVVLAAFGALLFVGHGPYLVRHELEANGGYTDIAFHPQLDRWPQIGHAALIELKYLKAKDDASPEALAKLKADAAKQLDKYAADRDLARQWHLAQGTKHKAQSTRHKAQGTKHKVPSASPVSRSSSTARSSRSVKRSDQIFKRCLRRAIATASERDAAPGKEVEGDRARPEFGLDGQLHGRHLLSRFSG